MQVEMKQVAEHRGKKKKKKKQTQNKKTNHKLPENPCW